MNILFVHNNFPGQFRHLAQALARDPKMTVIGVGSATSRPVPGVRLVKYSLNSVDVSATHPFARRFDVECYRAEQVLYSLTSLVSSGFVPDVIVAGAVAELVGIDGGVVSGVINLESSGVEASDWRPRHEERYHEA